MQPAHTRTEAPCAAPPPSRMDMNRSHQSSCQLAQGAASSNSTKHGTIPSVTAAVKESERLQTELSRPSVQSRQLQSRRKPLLAIMEQFMREQDLKSLRTKSGNLVVKFVERCNRVRPGKKAIEVCIQQALCTEHRELATQLIRFVYETNTVKCRVTQVETSS